MNSGCGIFHWGCGPIDLPDECLQFVREQCKRFQVKNLDEYWIDLIEVVQSIGNQVVYIFDSLDPYLLFIGITEVNLTHDWEKYAFVTYEDINDPNETPDECEPEKVESYSYAPGQSEEFFEYCLSHPGLDAIPYNVGHLLREQLEELMHIEQFSHDGQNALEMMSSYLSEDGRVLVSDAEMRGLLELITWASFLWFVGPPGRGLRRTMCELFDTAMEFGECIIYDMVIIPPPHYKKLERPAKSCFKCGIDAWCVEMTSVEGRSRYICESCLKSDMPVFPPANCGSRFCRWIECPHHPDHSLTNAGIHEFYRKHGQLNAMNKGRGREIAGGGTNPLLGD